jgi:hypothetical protein
MKLPIENSGADACQYRIPKQSTLDFCSQEWQIGLHEAQFRRRQAIVFDAGRDMLAMLMRAGSEGAFVRCCELRNSLRTPSADHCPRFTSST